MKPREEKMAEDCYFLNKETLVIKLPKKSTILLRMIVLGIVMICSVCISSVCLKQTKIQNKPSLARINLIEQLCHNPRNQQLDIPYLHYPEPTTYNRNECACTPVQFFAIVSMQRSGSGWFETLLNSHINVSSNGEIFLNRERRSNMSVITRTLDKVYNLDWNSSASKDECTAAVGFKWMLNQGLMDHYEEISKYFTKRGVSVIFLFRRNQLRQWISLLANSHDQYAKQLNGTHKAHVHSQYEADILARYKPVLDANSLIIKLKQLNDWATEAIEHLKNTRHILLYYEDLIWSRSDMQGLINKITKSIIAPLPSAYSGPLRLIKIMLLKSSEHRPSKMKEVMEFLGVPQRKLISHHVKIHTKPISDLVGNWDDVRDAITGTHYANFITQDYQL